MNEGVPLGRILGSLAWILVALLIVVGLLVGGASGCKAWTRYQARADANNHVKLSAIQIKNQQQRIQVTKQQAQIRYQRAVGIREAQDEIAKTLTPLYVQFEMIDALRQIAQSGSNSSVIYIPTNEKGGLATIPTLRVGEGK